MDAVIAQPSIQLVGRKYRSRAAIAAIYLGTFGVAFLASTISAEVKACLFTEECALCDADAVLLVSSHRKSLLLDIMKFKINELFQLKEYVKNSEVKILETPIGRLILDYSKNRFTQPPQIKTNGKTFDEIYQAILAKNTTEEARDLYQKNILYGPNSLGIEPPTITELILRAFCNRYFLWEMLTLLISISRKYYKYVFVIGGIFFYNAFLSLYYELKARSKLLELDTTNNIKVLRNGNFTLVSETAVLPGDIVYVTKADNWKCDVLILKGDVIVDESFLTGESVPICKGVGATVYSGTKILKSVSDSVPLTNSRMLYLVKVKNLCKQGSLEKSTNHLNPEENKSEDTAIGIVVKTGKRTKRGQNLQNLLFKKPLNNAFEVQSSQIIQKVCIVSGILMLICMISLYRKVSFRINFENSLDMFLTFFNPSLKTTQSLGIQHATQMLLGKRINATDPERIPTAGDVDMVVFDKTGTLTEMGVDILCVDKIKSIGTSFSELDMITALGVSTCHYVLELDGQYSGDVLDMKMFQFSKSRIHFSSSKRFIEIGVGENELVPVCKREKQEEQDEYFVYEDIPRKGKHFSYGMAEVHKIYDFDSFLKRMSVVISWDSKKYVFCKGAPDEMAKIIRELPAEYKNKVSDYGLEGHRVITLAYKEINQENESIGNRTADEKDLNFLGFIVFANRLKRETTEIIGELRAADMMPKMCTGDNILTAISVARACGMIDDDMPVLFPVVDENTINYDDVEWICAAEDEFVFDKVRLSLYGVNDPFTPIDFVVACEGREYDFLKNTHYHKFILEKGAVYARFNPDNKKSLVEDYTRLRKCVMYCGDGANDTGALSAADVGLALAANEASLASSFNSLHLTAVTELIKEGRSAMVMVNALFKYAFYAQALMGIQMLVLLPYQYFPSDMMSLISDVGFVYALSTAISRFKASVKIAKKKVLINLKRHILINFLELLVLTVIFLLVGYLRGIATAVDNSHIIQTRSSYATIIFIASLVLFLMKVVLLADFGVYREKRRKNYFFLLISAAFGVFCITIVSLLVFNIASVMSLFEFEKLEQKDLNYLFLTTGTCAAVTYLFSFLY
ncbi:cation-transporting P-type ATPase 13A2 [Enteropsectra breve]|nr:cation-transporting P-type ATPase 13A2 [Enteropsectra breve]